MIREVSKPLIMGLYVGLYVLRVKINVNQEMQRDS